MNCIDIGKDAMADSFLNNRTHGDFMRNSVIEPLFEISELQPADQSYVKGVGDEKDEIKKKIQARFFLNDIPKQQLNTLISSNGTDNRHTGFYAASDAGRGPDRFFSQYTLVITPASILDPASRDFKHQPQINGITDGSSINEQILNEVSMTPKLKGVTYVKKRAGKYVFSFKIDNNDELYELTDKVTSTHPYFRGNAVKNSFIANNYNDPSSLPAIQRYTLMKELGDTLQVMWLKKIRDERNLQKDITVICTSDTVVWLRSIVNEVSCIFTDTSHVSTFYPTAVSQGAKLAAQEFNKRKAFNDMKKTNEGIIRELRIRLDSEYTFADVPIKPDALVIINKVLDTLVKYLTPVLSDILIRAQRMQGSDMKEYKEFCDSRTFIKPFHIDTNKKNLKQNSKFEQTKYFLPKLRGGEKKHRFEPGLCYNLVKGLSRVTIDQILQEITLADEGYETEGGNRSKVKVKPTKQRGGVNENIIPIFNANRDTPGFLTYFIITYIPEFLYIGYSYASVIEHPALADISNLFNSEYIKKACDSFGKVNKDNIIDTYPGGDMDHITQCQRLMMIVLVIMATANRTLSHMGPRTVSIFDLVRERYHDTASFLELISTIETPEVNELFKRQLTKEEVDFHWRAIDEYQALYEAEASLTLFNKRDIKTPVEYIREERNRINIRHPAEKILVSPKAAAKGTNKNTRRKKIEKSIANRRMNMFTQKRRQQRRMVLNGEPSMSNNESSVSHENNSLMVSAL